MIDIDHDPAQIARLDARARIYLRPVAMVDGPILDPAQVRQLGGGSVWFSAVNVIARLDDACESARSHSCLVSVSAMDRFIAALPAHHRTRALSQWQALTSPRQPLDGLAGDHRISFARPLVMGILNVTPDSFSDGGKHLDPAAALEAAYDMRRDGADIIDVGAESTRPGAEPLWEGDELARLEPVLRGLAGFSAPISLDTRKASVMQAGLDLGTALINDVSALTHDPGSAAVIAKARCPVVLMHARGEPGTMQDDPRYDDVLLDVFDALESRMTAALSAGIAHDRIWLDPGIGFGKSLRHNLALLNGIGLLHALGCPLVLGVSRKRFIGALADVEAPDARVPGSIAAALRGLDQGVQVLRVHDVAQTVQAVRVWQGLRDEGVMPPV